MKKNEIYLIDNTDLKVIKLNRSSGNFSRILNNTFKK